jgi:hypothetical protein
VFIVASVELGSARTDALAEFRRVDAASDNNP